MGKSLRKKDRRQLDTFMTRTRQIFRHQADRAASAGIALDYDLAGLRAKVAVALADGICTGCSQPLTTKNFGLDHRDPVARGGQHSLTNLDVCCMTCNTVKGPLTSAEYGRLTAFVATLPADIGKNLLARIKAGSRFAKLGKRAAATS